MEEQQDKLNEMRQKYANLCALFGEKVFQSRMINEETDQLIVKLKKMNAEMFAMMEELKKDESPSKDQLLGMGDC